MSIELNTPDKLEYQFYPVNRPVINFKIRAPNDAHIALTSAPADNEPITEIFIGGWGNTKTVIRRNKTKPEKAETPTPDILNPGEFRGFWIRWTADNIITVGHEGQAAAFISWQDPDPHPISYFGVCTGWGASGSWIIDDSVPAYGFQPMMAGGGHGGAPCWVPCSNGEFPPEAVGGGQDGETLFVARARHENSLLPGKLVPSHGVCYVPWGGGEHSHGEYEVLCGCNPTWIPVSGTEIPPQAMPAGESEDGEPLFVGRVHHEGTLTIGKIQPSHGVCYIPYGGQELAFQDYEIMVTQY